MRTCSQRRAAGFTYLGLLIFLAIMAAATAASLQVGSLLARRAAEEELLAIGMEFQAALIHYANATPPGRSRLPPSLDDLLRDPRYPGVRRYLRRVYADPLTGRADWGLLMAPDGSGIAGIHSVSEQAPIKTGNFDMALQGFENAGSYRAWVFRLPLPAAPQQ